MPHSGPCCIARHTLSALHDQIRQRHERMMALEGLIEIKEDHLPYPPTYAALSHLARCTASQAWSALWLDAQLPERGASCERVARSCWSTVLRTLIDLADPSPARPAWRVATPAQGSAR